MFELALQAILFVFRDKVDTSQFFIEETQVRLSRRALRPSIYLLFWSDISVPDDSQLHRPRPIYIYPFFQNLLQRMVISGSICRPFGIYFNKI